MSLIAKTKELRQKRAGIVAEAGKTLTKAADEKRDMTAEEKAFFESRHADADKMKAEIDTLERQIEAERSLAAGGATNLMHGAGGEAGSGDAEVRKKFQAETFNRWMRWGLDGLDGEQRKAMAASYQQDAEFRALSGVTGVAGAYTIPQGFANQIDIATKYWGGILAVADILSTGSGSDMPYPSANDTSNIGEQLGENTAAAGEDGTADPGFAAVTMKAWMWSSKIVLIPLQLLQDSYFDVETMLAEMLGQRLGRAFNKACTTGLGVTTCQGIVPAATVGVTTASATAIAWTELVDLEHSVDRTYRQKARWMFHDSTLAAFKKITDNYGRPLWLPGLAVNAPDTFMNYPYVVNNDMDAIAATKKTVLFGDMSKYKVRQVNGRGLVTFRERYMNALQVGFLSFWRADGRLVDAGMHPVQCLQQKA